MSCQPSSFGAFIRDNTAETSDSADNKTIEIAKITKAEPVKINITSIEISLFATPFRSATALARDTKLEEDVVMWAFAN